MWWKLYSCFVQTPAELCSQSREVDVVRAQPSVPEEDLSQRKNAFHAGGCLYHSL